MKFALPGGMPEAMRLTRTGRLTEATAMLQRMLAGRGPETADTTEPGSITIEGVVEPTVAIGPARLQSLSRSAERSRPRGHGDSTPDTALPNRPRTAFAPDQEWLRKLRGGLASPSAATTTVELPTGGQFLSGTFSNHAGSRPYKLYVPSGYSSDKATSLIVMLHGCTQSPDDFAAGTRMNEVAGQHNCLVVYPAQTTSANMQKCWNWFNASDQQRDSGEPSLIAGITREVMRDYTVDPRKVYVAGLSAGGAAGAVLGEAYPDLYAAVGVHSGLPRGAAHDMPSAFAAMRAGSSGSLRDTADTSRSGTRPVVPIIVFHGDRDPTVNPRNADAVVAQSARAETLRIRTEEGKVAGGYTYSRRLYADARGCTVIEQWVVHGGGHAWFGGSLTGSYTDPKGPDATGEMVRFFLDHSQEVTRG